MSIKGSDEYAIKKILAKREEEGDFIRSVVLQGEIDEYWERVCHQMAH